MYGIPSEIVLYISTGSQTDAHISRPLHPKFSLDDI